MEFARVDSQALEPWWSHWIKFQLTNSLKKKHAGPNYWTRRLHGIRGQHLSDIPKQFPPGTELYRVFHVVVGLNLSWSAMGAERIDYGRRPISINIFNDCIDEWWMRGPKTNGRRVWPRATPISPFLSSFFSYSSSTSSSSPVDRPFVSRFVSTAAA